LIKNRYVDERRNFMLSTESAIKYLIYLKKKFGSWFLTMAAYNCGEGNMKKYMEYQKKDNFFDLRLPNETERYLYRIAVAKLIMENPGNYGYVIPQKNIYTPFKMDLVKFKLNKDVYTNDFAEVFNLSYMNFKKLNPQFLGSVMFKGSYRINIPEDQTGHVNLWLKEISEIKPVKKAKQRDFYYIVKKGDTLGKIAYRNGTSINKLKKINNLKSSTIYVGQKIRVKS